MVSDTDLIRYVDESIKKVLNNVKNPKTCVVTNKMRRKILSKQNARVLKN